ncbi:MAG TPA: hypothetical protein VIX80_10940 [Candidatus Kapabacteria bacterium]
MSVYIKHIFLLFSLSILVGCDEPGSAPRKYDGGNYSLTEYLRTMKKVKVTFIAGTNHRYVVDQGSLDSGSAQDIWFTRQYQFVNSDSAYSLSWQDSTFSTRTCFSLHVIDGMHQLEGGCDNNSLTRASVDDATKTITGLLCFYRSLDGKFDPTTYKSIDASLNSPRFVIDSLFEDSITFVATDQISTTLSYKSEEVAYSTYKKTAELTEVDKTGGITKPLCRIVFSLK